MIDLYAWGTTNGRRALIMAEETGLPFTLHQINIHKGQQKTTAYEKINPNRKIPALVDSQGPGNKPATVFESIAICIYLAEKVGKFLGSSVDRPNVLKWSMFHATNVLSTMGQLKRPEETEFEADARTQFETMERIAGRVVRRGLLDRRHHPLHPHPWDQARPREGCELSERRELAGTRRRAACRQEGDGAEVRVARPAARPPTALLCVPTA